MMRSENFSFSFAENVSKFVILGRDIGKIRSFCKFCGVSLNLQRTKTESEIAGALEFLSQIRYSLVMILGLNSVLGV